jgi:8-oxo-dGTP pyrophosphatase MutT (NUDIX family)
MEIYTPPGVALKAGGLLYVPAGLVLVERCGTGIDGARDGLVIPKGTPQPIDAHLGKAAEREVLEETGYKSRAVMFLGVVSRGTIDVESPDSRKSINVFLMAGDGTRDPTVVPDQAIRLVDPEEAARGGIMRYAEEARFVARHLSTLMRIRGWN